MFRILNPRTDNKSLVANNPTCAIQQAVCSICSTAWMSHPLSFSKVNIPNNSFVEVIHIFFALSQFGYFVTIVSIWQRRDTLRKLGSHPSWAAFTFPFINTAITTSLYRRNFPRLGVWLDVLIFYHVSVAMVTSLVVCSMYIYNRLFLFPHDQRALISSNDDETVFDSDKVEIDHTPFMMEDK